jgi:hypothetical protein
MPFQIPSIYYFHSYASIFASLKVINRRGFSFTPHLQWRMDVDVTHNEWRMLLMTNKNLKAIFIFNQRLSNIFTVKQQIWLRHQIKGLISCEAYRRADPFPSILIWTHTQKEKLWMVWCRKHKWRRYTCTGWRICFCTCFPVIDNNPTLLATKWHFHVTITKF